MISVAPEPELIYEQDLTIAEYSTTVHTKIYQMAMTKTLSSTNSLEIYCQCLCMAIFDLLYEDIRYYYRHIEEDKLDNYCFFLTLQILRNVFEEIKQRISERKSSKLINAVGEINCAFHKSNKLGDGTYYRRKLAISLSFASLNSLKNLTKSKENEIKKSKSVHEFTIGEKIGISLL